MVSKLEFSKVKRDCILVKFRRPVWMPKNPTMQCQKPVFLFADGYGIDMDEENGFALKNGDPSANGLRLDTGESIPCFELKIKENLIAERSGSYGITEVRRGPLLWRQPLYKTEYGAQATVIAE